MGSDDVLLYCRKCETLDAELTTMRARLELAERACEYAGLCVPSIQALSPGSAHCRDKLIESLSAWRASHSEAP